MRRPRNGDRKRKETRQPTPHRPTPQISYSLSSSPLSLFDVWLTWPTIFERVGGWVANDTFFFLFHTQASLFLPFEKKGAPPLTTAATTFLITLPPRRHHPLLLFFLRMTQHPPLLVILKFRLAKREGEKRRGSLFLSFSLSHTVTKVHLIFPACVLLLLLFSCFHFRFLSSSAHSPPSTPPSTTLPLNHRVPTPPSSSHYN